MEERPKFSLFGAKGTNESSQSLVEGASQSPLSPFLPGSSGTDTPSAKRRLVDASSAIFAASPVSSELRRTQQRTAWLEIEVQRLQDQLSLRVARHEAALATRDARIAELEKDRRHLLDNEERMKKELESVRQHKDQSISSSRSRLGEVEGQRRELEERIRTMGDDLRRSQQALRQSHDECSTLKDRHAQELKNLQDVLGTKERLIRERDQRIASLEAALEQASKATPKPQDPSLEAPRGSLLEELHRLELQNRKLQFDNGLFREAAATRRILEEKLHAAEQRLAHFQHLEAENLQLRNQLQAADSSDRSRSPSAVAETMLQQQDTRSIRELLERTVALAKVEQSVAEMNARISILETELADARRQLETTQSQLTERTAQHDAATTALLQARQQETLLRAELDLVREQLQAAERIERASQSLIQSLAKKGTADGPK